MRPAGGPGAPSPPGEGTEELDVLGSAEAGGAAVRGGALRVIGYVIAALLSAGSAAVLFRHLGVANTGLYVTVLSLVTIVGGLSDLGLTSLGIRELSVRDEAQRRELVRTLLGLRITVTLAGVACVVIFSLLVGYRPVVVAGVAIAGAGLLLGGLQSTLSIPLMVDLRLGWVTAMDLLRQVASVALIVVLVVLGAGLLMILAISIPVGLVVLAATAALVRGKVPVVPSFRWTSAGRLLKDVLPYAVAVATGVVYFRASVIAVSIVASAQELGYFGSSFRVLEVLISVPGLLVSAAFPIFARSAHNDHERLAFALDRVFVVALMTGVWFVLVLALGAGLVIDLIGGSKFAPAASILRIQAFALGGSFVASVWSIALLSLRQQRALIWISVGALLAGVTLATILASLFGGEGAAAATVSTEIGLAIAGVLVLRRSHPHVVPVMRSVPRILLAGGLAGLLAAVLPIPAALAMVLATVVYGSLLLVAGVVPAELLAELPGRRRSKRGRLAS